MSAAGSSENEVPQLTRQLTSNFDDYKTFMEDDDDDAEIKRQQSKQLEESIENATKHVPLDTTGNNVEMRMLTGVATDIGGGNENQDKAMLFWAGEGEQHLVMGVFDGHGRELGELAAIVCRDYMKDELAKPEIMKQIAANPKTEFDRIFTEAHKLVLKEFKAKFEGSDWEVTETAEGYLTRKNKRYSSGVTNINGGTTATVVVILDGWRVIVANVGDSTALFGGINSKGVAEFKELSAEHSPESVEEFVRVRKQLPSAHDPTQPDLKFVYDVFDNKNYALPKYQCPPIFQVDPKDASKVTCTGVGYYYKNVRSEWATLVSTPPHARFQDALAFTRSLGDFHLHVYGVSHIPEVQEYNLNDAHEPYSDKAKCSVIFVCTDGVWDNWKYEDIVAKTLNDSFVGPALKAKDAQKLTTDLMKLNIKIAKQNFGNQADNMTGIVCLVQSPTQVAAMK